MAFLRRERQARFTAPSFHHVYLLSGHRSEQLETKKTQAVYPRRQYTDPSQAKELPPQRLNTCQVLDDLPEKSPKPCQHFWGYVLICH